MAKLVKIELPLKDLMLVTDAIHGYTRWLEAALEETHWDLSKARRKKKYDLCWDLGQIRADIFNQLKM